MSRLHLFPGGMQINAHAPVRQQQHTDLRYPDRLVVAFVFLGAESCMAMDPGGRLGLPRLNVLKGNSARGLGLVGRHAWQRRFRPSSPVGLRLLIASETLLSKNAHASALVTVL